MSRRIALFGATGFVGSAVRDALAANHDVLVISSPRVSSTRRSPEDVLRASAESEHLPRLAAALAGVDVVINAAGNPDASSLDEDGLYGANALLPAVLMRAAVLAGVSRFVQVSSAAVQNDKRILDSSEDMRAFSPYSGSKVVGEQVVRELSNQGISVVRYRPPSVHAPGRRVSRMLARIASSPAASVARPGDQPTPQALLPNVASAIAFLSTVEATPPPVVHHPSEGVTVTSLMSDLSGGRRPLRLPRWLAGLVVSLSKLVGRVHRPTAANARRVELLWFGQVQADSWLSAAGWLPPIGRKGWENLAHGGRSRS